MLLKKRYSIAFYGKHRSYATHTNISAAPRIILIGCVLLKICLIFFCHFFLCCRILFDRSRRNVKVWVRMLRKLFNIVVLNNIMLQIFVSCDATLAGSLNHLHFQVICIGVDECMMPTFLCQIDGDSYIHSMAVVKLHRYQFAAVC